MSYYRHHNHSILGLSSSEAFYLFISLTTFSGILMSAGVFWATPVFLLCMLLWSCVFVAVIVVGGGGLVLVSPIFILGGILHCLEGVSEKTSPIKPRTLRKSCSTLNGNDYSAIRLDNISVAPLDETNLQAFRNTDAYKNAQLAYSRYTKEQAAAYKKTQPAYPTSETTKQYASY